MGVSGKSPVVDRLGTAIVHSLVVRQLADLDGTIEVIGPPPRFNRIAACKSSGHRFELTR